MIGDEFGTRHRPTEIRLKGEEKALEIDFEDGKSFRLPAELLRVESPSAEVQGHGPGQKTLVAGRRHVGIMAVEPVGNYAIRINEQPSGRIRKHLEYLHIKSDRNRDKYNGHDRYSN